MRPVASWSINSLLLQESHQIWIAKGAAEEDMVSSLHRIETLRLNAISLWAIFLTIQSLSF